MIVNANILLLTNKMDINETYVLSENKKEIILPKIMVDDTNKNNLISILNNKILTILSVNELELIPQITSHHYIFEKNEDSNKINIIFSYLVSYCNIIDKEYSWFKFHWATPNKLNDLLYQTIQLLR